MPKISTARGAEDVLLQVELGAENYYEFDEIVSADFVGQIGVVAQSNQLCIFKNDKFDRILTKDDLVGFPFSNFSPKKVRISGDYIMVLLDAGIAPKNLLKISTIDFSVEYIEKFGSNNIVDFEIYSILNGVIFVNSKYEFDVNEYFYFSNGAFGEKIEAITQPHYEPTCLISDDKKSVENLASDNVFTTKNDISNAPQIVSTSEKYVAVYDESGVATILTNDGQNVCKIQNIANASSICLGDESLYVAFADGIKKYDFEGKIVAENGENTLCVSLVYTSKKQVICLDSVGKITLLDANLQNATTLISQSQAEGAKQIATSERNSNLYILYADKVEVFDGNQIESVSNVGGDNFAIDFGNNIYIQNGDDIFAVKSDAETQFSMSLEANYFSTPTINSLAINKHSGNLLCADKTLSTVFFITKETLGIKLFDDLPNVTIEKKSSQKDFSQAFEVLKINGFPSTVFYPQSNSDANFEEEFSFAEIRYLPIDSQVVEIFSSGDYSYVFDMQSQKCGFVLSVATTKTNLAKPFETQKKVLNSISKLYMIPTQSNAVFDLQKDSIVDLKYTIQLSGGEYAFVEQGTNFGFVSTHNLSNLLTTAVDLRQNAKTLGADNKTVVYQSDSTNSAVVIVLKDKSIVKVQQKVGHFYLVEYQDGDQSYVGYVESKFLVFNGFSNSQRLGLIIFASMVALLVLTILIRRRIIN